MGETQEQMQKDLAELRAIRERIDSAIVDLQRVTFEARADEVQMAVRAAVSHLRFYGSGHGPKGAMALREIVRLLSPEVFNVLENEGEGEAHKIVDASMREGE
jgi:L-fucose mutarotase/ribose pyranase (RbsD/FucU family)